MLGKFITRSITTILALSVAGILFSSYANSASPGVILSTHASCMLGYTREKQWYPTTERTKLPVDFISPEKYDLFGLTTNKRNIKTTPLALQEYPCDSSYYVNFTPKIKDAYTALGNINWNPIPRAVTILKSNNVAYKKVIADLLREKGVKKPKVRIVQIVKTDVQGDGKDEVFISATYFTANGNGPGWEYAPMYVRKGDYSFVALREVIDEKPATRIVVGDIFLNDSVSPEPDIPPPAPNEYHINAILDLNGDGNMELVIDNTIHEGIASAVYIMKRDKFEETLYCGCGL